MIDIFVNALRGDPASQQHVAWIISKPMFWLFILHWILVVVGIGIILTKLITSQRYILTALALLLVCLTAWGYTHSMQASLTAFTEGRIPFGLFQIIKYALYAFAIGVAVYLLRGVIRRSRPQAQ